MEMVDDLRARRFAPKEVRRQQLIEATLEVIAEKGVSGTTMAEVARAANLSVGTVNLHFDSKDNLLKSTLRYLSEELQSTWSAIHQNKSLSAAQKIWGVIDASYHPNICTAEKVRVWFGFFGEARYRAFYRETVECFDDERGRVIENLIRQMSQEDAVRSVDAEALTQSVESMSDGLWLSLMLYPDWMTVDVARMRLWELLTIHFPKKFPPVTVPSISEVK